MPAQKSQNTPSKSTDSHQVKADSYYTLYNQTVLQQPARLVHLLAIPVMLFSLFGLLWAIPFPHLNFMGVYNGYINWASFLLAFMIYYYLRMSPMVSYLILFFLLVCAYGVVQLLAWQTLGGPKLWLVCAVLFIVSTVALVFSGNRPNSLNKTRLILAGPLWEAYTLIRRKPHV
ncbi:hypothetical protein GCM10027037_34540 [Mucilaginibacter koreensis]